MVERRVALLTLIVGGLLSVGAASQARAAVAVQATIMDRSSVWQGGVIVTRFRLRVDRVMRGAAPSVVEVTELGGRVGDLAQVVHGQPAMPRLPNVAVELAPVGDTWRVTAVLEQVASVDATAPAKALADTYVRTTTKDSTPPCEGEQKAVSWPIANVHYVLDAACVAGIENSACEAAVIASFQTWQDVECSYLSFTYDGQIVDAPVGYNRNGGNVNVVKWVQSDWPGSPDAQAITLGTIGCSSGHQMDADILVNGTMAVPFSTAPQPGEFTVDIQNTLTHEAGHLIGFAHSSDPQSTMFSTAQPNETEKRDLTAGDAQGLCEVYPLGHEPGRGDGCTCATPDGGTTTTASLLVVLALLARRRRGRPPGLARSRH